MKKIITLLLVIALFGGCASNPTQPAPKKYYKTWTVVKVTEDKIYLERKKGEGKVDEVSIERSRRPYLKVGAKVRYDKIRNRLRKTISNGDK